MRRKFSLILLALLAFLGFAVISSQKVKAAEPVGKIVFHYQLWDGDYSSAGLWCWNTGDGGSQAPVTSSVTDDFGAVYEVNIGTGAADVGIIACRKDITLDSRWNYRETPDGYNFTIDPTPILNGTTKEMHVYYFQGGYQTYYIVDTSKVNIFVNYYDPAKNYEDNLGFHLWGNFIGVEAPAWATPAKLFTNGFKSPADIQGKTALLQIDEADIASAGFLVYAGDDASKKTPEQDTCKYITDFASLKNGTVKVLYVSGGKAYEKTKDFVDTAFKFDFASFNASDLSGTYAVDPQTIFANFSIAVSTKVVTGTEMVTKTRIVQKAQLAEGSTPYKQTDKTFTKFTSLPALKEGMVGRVVLHYQAWNGDYTGVGVWSWNTGTGAKAGLPSIGVDSFGAVVDIQVAADCADSIGFIPMKSGVVAETNDWDSNFVKSFDGDLSVDVTSIKNKTLTEIHVYYFEGGSKGFVAKADEANVLVVYYDLEGKYEENLGVHAWGNYTSFDASKIAWGTPEKVFENGFTSPKTFQGKVAHMTAKDFTGAGFLVYAGGDDSKKTPEKNASDYITDLAATKAGEVKVLYIALNNGYYGENAKAEFAEAAFSGNIEYVDVEEEYQEEVDVMDYVDFSKMFKLYEGTNEIAIKQIDFNKTSTSSNEFVIQLDTKLDNTKEYILKFDDGADNKAEIKIAMDSEKPVITLVSEEKIVIKQGDKWDQTLYPNYRVTDDRDTNLSNRVYVPAGKGTLNTNVAGDYPITLQVEDNWGNVGELVFTITVEPVKTGCGSGNAATFVGLSILGLALFFIRRRFA